MKCIAISLLTFLFLSHCLKGQINVSMEFSRISLGVGSIYITDDVDQEDELRFKHQIESGNWSGCAEKLLSSAWDNNRLGLSGGNITGTATSSAFNRNFQYWEEDTGDGCTMNVDRCVSYIFGECVWRESDARRTSGTQRIELNDKPSGTWIEDQYSFYSSNSMGVYFRVKWDMPQPSKPELDTSGIQMVCSGKPFKIRCLNTNLPSGFDLSQVTYHFEYSYIDNPASFTTLAIQTGNNEVETSIPARATRGNIYFRVNTSYKGGAPTPSITSSMDVLVPAPTFSGINLVNHVSCFGYNDGSLIVKGLTSVVPGNRYTLIALNNDTGDPVYSQPRIETDAVIPNLPAGQYRIILKTGDGGVDDQSDYGECNVKVPVNIVPLITAPGSRPYITSINVPTKNGTDYHVTCQAGSPDQFEANGEIVLSATGGTGGGYKSSSEFFTNSELTITGLRARSYSIFIQDEKGCKSLEATSVSISAPTDSIALSSISNTLYSTYHISCFEGSNGNILVQVNDRGNVGTVKYEVSKIDGSSYQNSGVLATNSGYNFPSLTAGQYQVRVTDALGCTQTLTNGSIASGYTLVHPPKLEIAALQHPISSTIVGFANPYNNFDVSCSYNHDGFVNVVPKGGVGGYIYTTTGTYLHQSNPESLFTDLLQSTPYTFTLKDANGCTTEQTTTLNNIPAPLAIESLDKRVYNGFNTSCHTQNEAYTPNGSVTIVGIGGVYFKAYTIEYGSDALSVRPMPLPGNWHGQIFNNLPWNTHEFQLKDANNCVLTGNFYLSQPPQLSITGIVPTLPLCHHYRDGLFAITLAGGVYPQYQSVFKQQNQVHPEANGDLPNNPFKTRALVGENLQIDSVDAGSYRIDIVDVNGCTLWEAPIAMGEPNPLSVTSIVGFVPCKEGRNGRFITQAQGGTPPYMAWLDGTLAGVGSPMLTFTGLYDHTYTLHLTDAHQCNNFMKNNSIAGARMNDVIIKAPPEKLGFGKLNRYAPSCFGNSDGRLIPEPKGGYGDPTKMRFSLDSIQYIYASQEFQNLSAINYRLILEETNEGGLCIVTTSVGISQPLPLSLTGIAKDMACFNQQNGMVILSATGGNGGYTYALTSNSFIGNSTFLGLDKGIYMASLKDSKNCPANTLSFTIHEPSLLTGSFQSQFSTCGEANGSITFTGIGGTPPYHFYSPNQASTLRITNYALLINNSPSGFYQSSITDANQCTLTLTGVVNDLNGPTVSGVLLRNASCDYVNDGATKLSINALSASLKSVVWSSSDTVSRSLEATNLKGNILYSVLAEDIYGCKAGDTVWVAAPEKLRVALVGATDPQCHNEANGSLTFSGTGGTKPFILQSEGTDANIMPIQNSKFKIQNLLASTFDVKMIDNNNCTASGTGSLSNPNKVVVTLTSYSGLVCEGQKYTLNADKPLNTRGKNKFTWSGSNGFASANPKALVSVAGLYTISVADSMGCGADTSFALSTSRNLLKALFGATSHIMVGDTIVLVEYSWPAPDSVAYSLPASFTFITASGDNMYTAVIPQEVGNFELSINVALAECQDQLTKHIHVSARTALGSNLRLGYKGITEASLYPNPAENSTLLSLQLTEAMPIEIQIRTFVGDEPIWHKTWAGEAENEVEIMLGNFPSGVYVVYATTESSVKVLKLTVVR